MFASLASALVATVLLIGLSPTQATAADPRKPSLHWTRGVEASACIDARALAARVEALTGRVFVAPQDSDYAVEGHIEKQRGGGFRVRLAVSKHGAPHAGERMLSHQSTDCHALDESLAFVIALTIDPDLQLASLLLSAELGERTPEEVLLAELDARTARALPHTHVQTKVAPSVPLAPSVVALPKAHWELSLGPLFAARELREPSLGVIADALFQGEHWLAASLQVRTLSTLRSTRLEPDLSVRSDAFAAALLACARGHLWSALSAGGCAGPEPELVVARGLGFSEERVARTLVWGVLAKVELHWHMRGAWSLGLQGLLRANLQTRRFTYGRAGTRYAAYASERIGVGVALGMSYAFPSGKIREPATHVQSGRERAR